MPVPQMVVANKLASVMRQLHFHYLHNIKTFSAFHIEKNFRRGWRDENQCLIEFG